MEMDDLPIRATFSDHERIAPRQIYRLVPHDADNRVKASHDNGRIRDLQDRMFAEGRSVLSAAEHSLKYLRIPSGEAISALLPVPISTASVA